MHIRPFLSQPRTGTWFDNRSMIVFCYELVHIFQFTCSNLELRVVTKHCYLGLWFNEHLYFKDTASKVAKSAHQALGLLISKFKLCGGMPFDCFTTLYESLVLPIISYGAAIWGTTDYSCINSVHNGACRYY